MQAPARVPSRAVAEADRELVSVHFRHGDVGDNQVERAAGESNASVRPRRLNEGLPFAKGG